MKPKPTMTSVRRESLASERKRQEKVKKEEEQQKEMSKERQTRTSKTSVPNYKTDTSHGNKYSYSKHTPCDDSKGDRQWSTDKRDWVEEGSRNSSRNNTGRIGCNKSEANYNPKEYEDRTDTRSQYGTKCISKTKMDHQLGSFSYNMFENEYGHQGGQKKTPDYSAATGINRSYIPESASEYTHDTDVDTHSSPKFVQTGSKDEVNIEKKDKTVSILEGPDTDVRNNEDLKEHKGIKKQPDSNSTGIKQGDEDKPREKEKKKKEKSLKWPEEEIDVTRDKNLRFYRNEIKSSQWFGYTIEEMLKWKGNYWELETNHQYIQWLFPNFDSSGININAQPLQPHEVVAITEDPVLKDRFLRAYEMMLDFYGLKLTSREKGEVEKNENWESRFEHLNRSTHNHLRISRILNALASFGFGHFLMPLLSFLMSEEKHLPNLQNRTMNRWLNRALDTDGFQFSDDGSDDDDGVAGSGSHTGSDEKETAAEKRLENKTDEENFEVVNEKGKKVETLSKDSCDKREGAGESVGTGRKPAPSVEKDGGNSHFDRERDESGGNNKPIKQSSLEGSAREEIEMRQFDENLLNEKGGDVKHPEQEIKHAAVCLAEVKVADISAGKANDGAGSKTNEGLEDAQRESGYSRVSGGTQFVGCDVMDLRF